MGQIELQTGEIAEDLTYYFAVSEQVPSVVGLGVLMNRDNTVRQAGGFIVQLMPFAEEEMIGKLEENIKNLSSVTTMLDAGKTRRECWKYCFPEWIWRSPIHFLWNLPAIAARTE